MPKLDQVLDQARDLEQGGNLTAAVKALDGAGPPERETGLWHYARGAMAQRQGQLAEAVQHFEKAVALEPEVGEYRANLGGALLEQVKAGQTALLETATKTLEEAVRWAPRLPSAANNLGLAYLLAKRPKDALARFDEALAMDPKHVPTLYNRAAALDALGDSKACLEALDAVLAVDAAFAPALASRERTKKKLGS